MTDVIVVGGGACGLTAALAAAQHSAQVTLIEKSFDSRSNTARSSGMIPAAGTRFQKAAGIEETPEDFAIDILNKNKHKSDPAITRHMTNVIPEVVEWLVDECSVTLEFVDDFTYPGHSTYRMHAPPNRTGGALHADMLRAAEAHGNITILDHTAVTDVALTADGASVSIDSSVTPLTCKKLILATNGFGANRDMVREFTPDIASAMYFGSPGNTGEGIAWGIEHGAATAYMDAYQGHNSVSTQANELISYAMVTEGGFQVNKHGQRFGTEDQGYSERALEVLAQPDGIAWDIYDEKIHQLGLTFEKYQVAMKVDAIKSADTPETLAELLGIDVNGLAATMAAFNAAGRGDADDEQGRDLARSLEPPYYGVKVTGALFHTQGGLVVDEVGRVLREDGTPIPNLYAGGGTAASVSGHGAAGYLSGNGLLTAFVYGYLAGRHAAETVNT